MENNSFDSVLKMTDSDFLNFYKVKNLGEIRGILLLIKKEHRILCATLISTENRMNEPEIKKLRADMALVIMNMENKFKILNDYFSSVISEREKKQGKVKDTK